MGFIPVSIVGRIDVWMARYRLLLSVTRILFDLVVIHPSFSYTKGQLNVPAP
jgi:hypothetical protein